MADGWLSTLLGYHRIKKSDGTEVAQRSTVKFLGATVTDDTTNKQTVVDISAGVNGTVTVRKNTGSDVGTRGRLNLIEGAGVALTVADDAGSSEVDITIAADETLQEAYDNGGTADVVVASASNNWLIRAADAVSDVLLRFRRNLTGVDAEQTLLKAPDAIATGVDGTRLDLLAGAGKAGTGATDGSAGGGIKVRGGTGGTAVTGDSGAGGALDFEAGAGGAHSGATGQPEVGGNAYWKAGDGGASTDDAVAGADGGDAEIDAGAGGAGTGGEGGSASGTGGVVRIGQKGGTARASAIEVGFGADTIRSGLTNSGTLHQLRGQVSVGHPVDPDTVLALDCNRASGGGAPIGAFGLPSFTSGELTALEAVATPPDRSVVYNSSLGRAEIYVGGVRQPLSAPPAGTYVIPASALIASVYSDWAFDVSSNVYRYSSNGSGQSLAAPLNLFVPNGAKITGLSAKVNPTAVTTDMDLALYRVDPNYATPSGAPSGTNIANQASSGSGLQVITLSGLTAVVDYSTYEYLLVLKAGSSGDLAYAPRVTFAYS